MTTDASERIFKLYANTATRISRDDLRQNGRNIELTVFQPQQYSKTVRYPVSHQTEYILSF
jgi:hypothetical protein